MNYEFKVDQSEEYYRKLLLLDKIKPFLCCNTKQYIFNQGYCWNILFNDKDAHTFCYNYANVIEKRFPEGEPYIAKSSYLSFRYANETLKESFPLGEKAIATNALNSVKYAMKVLNDRFPLGEPTILNSPWKLDYIHHLKEIKKLDEIRAFI